MAVTIVERKGQVGRQHRTINVAMGTIGVREGAGRRHGTGLQAWVVGKRSRQEELSVSTLIGYK